MHLSDSSLPRVSPSSFVLLPLCSPSISYAGIRWHCARGHLCVWLVRFVRPMSFVVVCAEREEVEEEGLPPVNPLTSCQPSVLHHLAPRSMFAPCLRKVIYSCSLLLMPSKTPQWHHNHPPVTPPLGPSLHPHSPLPLYPNSISHYPPYRSCDPSGKAAPSR